MAVCMLGPARWLLPEILWQLAGKSLPQDYAAFLLRETVTQVRRSCNQQATILPDCMACGATPSYPPG
eukprot:COSAG01_NODE_43694_length_427_cov_0.881098_2_plen_67_part_01